MQADSDGPYVDELLVLLLKIFETRFALKRFVPAEETEESIRVERIKWVVDFRVIRRSLAEADFIAGEAEVADDEAFLFVPQVQHRLEVAVKAHPLGVGITDKCDPFALHEFQRQLTGR